MKIQKQVEVINKLGLHTRAAALLVKKCATFNSEITLSKDAKTAGEKTADAKSIMAVMMLAATQGSILQLAVAGDDAEVAAQTITDLFLNYFEEGE